jgi:hypothetical protein
MNRDVVASNFAATTVAAAAPTELTATALAQAVLILLRRLITKVLQVQ